MIQKCGKSLNLCISLSPSTFLPFTFRRVSLPTILWIQDSCFSFPVPAFIVWAEVMKVYVFCSHHLDGKFALMKNDSISSFHNSPTNERLQNGVYNYNSIVYIHFSLTTSIEF